MTGHESLRHGIVRPLSHRRPSLASASGRRSRQAPGRPGGTTRAGGLARRAARVRPPRHPGGQPGDVLVLRLHGAGAARRHAARRIRLLGGAGHLLAGGRQVLFDLLAPLRHRLLDPDGAGRSARRRPAAHVQAAPPGAARHRDGPPRLLGGGYRGVLRARRFSADPAAPTLRRAPAAMGRRHDRGGAAALRRALPQRWQGLPGAAVLHPRHDAPAGVRGHAGRALRPVSPREPHDYPAHQRQHRHLLPLRRPDGVGPRPEGARHVPRRALCGAAWDLPRSGGAPAPAAARSPARVVDRAARERGDGLLPARDDGGRRLRASGHARLRPLLCARRAHARARLRGHVCAAVDAPGLAGGAGRAGPGRAHGAHQLPDAYRHRPAALFGLRLRARGPRGARAVRAHRMRGACGAGGREPVVARALPLWPGGMGVAQPHLWRRPTHAAHALRRSDPRPEASL